MLRYDDGASRSSTNRSFSNSPGSPGVVRRRDGLADDCWQYRTWSPVRSTRTIPRIRWMVNARHVESTGWRSVARRPATGRPAGGASPRPTSREKATTNAGLRPTGRGRPRQAAFALRTRGVEPADQLGHTTTRMLDRHYRHLISDVVDTAVVVAERRAAERQRPGADQGPFLQ